MQFFEGSCDTHNLQGYFTGTEAIVGTVCNNYQKKWFG